VRHESLFDWMETLSCIALHYVTRLAPFYFLNSWYHAWVVFLLAEVVSSVWFSLQFAVNHELEAPVEFSESSGKVHGENRDWGVHQLLTSHNYSVGFMPALYVSGGLNYQIEHHLFPSVHCKHYPALADIVQQTAKEFNLPYNSSPNFYDSVVKHYNWLKEMGSRD